MSGKPKGKLAVYWAASCGGCEISILAIDEKILDVANAFDIVMWPCATDGKVHDVDNVYVNDAALLPDAPGVNPQASVMAVAIRNARRFADVKAG